MGDPAAPGLGAHHLQRPNLRNLDLRALPRDEGPPSETQLRRQKYQFFEKQCSEVAEGLFLAGDWVAKNREVLQEQRITHVVNCVGFICKEHFQGELDYKTYYLQGACWDGGCQSCLGGLSHMCWISTAFIWAGPCMVMCGVGSRWAHVQDCMTFFSYRDLQLGVEPREGLCLPAAPLFDRLHGCSLQTPRPRTSCACFTMHSSTLTTP